MTSSIPATPQLVPVFSVKLQLRGAPEPLFTDTSIKAISSMAIGCISTIKNDVGFELDVANIQGYDTITAHPEKGYSQLDAHLHGKTEEGADVRIDYFGLCKSLSGVDAVLSGKAATHSFDGSYLSNSPRITFSGTAPAKSRWTEIQNLIGKGRSLVEEGKTYVEYFAYAVR